MIIKTLIISILLVLAVIIMRYHDNSKDDKDNVSISFKNRMYHIHVCKEQQSHFGDAKLKN